MVKLKPVVEPIGKKLPCDDTCSLSGAGASSYPGTFLVQETHWGSWVVGGGAVKLCYVGCW